MPERFITALREYGLVAAALFQAIGAGVVVLLAFGKLAISAAKTSYNRSKLESEVHHTNAESTLILTKAHSIEVKDELSVVEMVKDLMHEGLALEQLLIEKNRIIAEHEDEEFEFKIREEDYLRQIRAYERQLGLRKQTGIEEKTGTSAS